MILERISPQLTYFSIEESNLIAEENAEKVIIFLKYTNYYLNLDRDLFQANEKFKKCKFKKMSDKYGLYFGFD